MLTIEVPAVDPLEIVRQSPAFRKAQDAAAQVQANEREAAVQNLIKVRETANSKMSQAGTDLTAVFAERDRIIAETLQPLADRINFLKYEAQGIKTREQQNIYRAEMACKEFVLPQVLAVLRTISDARAANASIDVMRMSEEMHQALVARDALLLDLERRAQAIALLPLQQAESEIGDIKTALANLS